MAFPPQYSDEKMHAKLVDWCNKAERCRGDLELKMRRWGASNESISQSIERLQKSNLFDDSRFASAFVHDKSSLQRWGVRKIRMYLKAKSISDDEINAALASIDQEEVLGNIQQLATMKLRSIKGKNEYERKMKLLQFLMRKGFTSDQIKLALAIQSENDDDINHP